MLRAFRRDPHEDLAGEWPIRGLGLAELQELFSEAQVDAMYDSHPVSQEQVPALERASGIALDLDRYEYSVDADAV